MEDNNVPQAQPSGHPDHEPVPVDGVDESSAGSVLVHKLDETDSKINLNPIARNLIIGLAVVVFYFAGLGIYWLRHKSPTQPVTGVSGQTAVTAVKNGKYKAGQMFGSDDPVFKDVAEGLLDVNKNPEKPGTHILIRGDESQTAYLTSSVLNLDDYVGYKVKVWGETQRVQEVGWFMDVGRLQILE